MKSFLAWGLLTLPPSWMVIDMLTVGNCFGGNVLPWAPNGVRFALLAALATLSGGVAVASKRTRAKPIFVVSLVVMWLVSGFMLWRSYQMSVAHQDAIWFGAALLFEAAVCVLTVRLLGRHAH